MNNSVIEEFENELVVSHRVIAEQTNNKEKSVLDLITRNISELEEFGQLRFKIATVRNSVGATNEQKTYYLNEPQATLLLTFMRNNEIVKAFKVRLVKEFFQMKKVFKTLTSEKVSLQDIRDRTELLNLSQEQYKIFEDVFYRIGITRKEELAITSNRAVQKETGVDFIELAEKKGISTPDRYFTVTELCQKVMNSDKFSEEAKKIVSTKAGDKPRPQNLNKLLETNGFQTKADGVWKPTEKAKDFSDFVQNKSISSEKTVYHLVWKTEILEEIF
jgi:phage regulator Rha-like protein